MGRVDAMEVQIVESVADDRSCGFRAVSPSPVGFADPVAQFSTVVFGIQDQTHRPAQSIVGTQDDRKIGPFPLGKIPLMS